MGWIACFVCLFDFCLFVYLLLFKLCLLVGTVFVSVFVCLFVVFLICCCCFLFFFASC